MERGRGRSGVIFLILPDTNIEAAPDYIKLSMDRYLCIRMNGYDDEAALQKLVHATRPKQSLPARLLSSLRGFFLTKQEVKPVPVKSYFKSRSEWDDSDSDSESESE